MATQQQHRKQRQSRSARALAKWIERSTLDIHQVAARLGIRGGTLYDLLAGRHLPSLRLAADIEDLTRWKVRIRGWVR